MDWFDQVAGYLMGALASTAPFLSPIGPLIALPKRILFRRMVTRVMSSDGRSPTRAPRRPPDGRSRAARWSWWRGGSRPHRCRPRLVGKRWASWVGGVIVHRSRAVYFLVEMTPDAAASHCSAVDDRYMQTGTGGMSMKECSHAYIGIGTHRRTRGQLRLSGIRREGRYEIWDLWRRLWRWRLPL